MRRRYLFITVVVSVLLIGIEKLEIYRGLIRVNKLVLRYPSPLLIGMHSVTAHTLNFPLLRSQKRNSCSTYWPLYQQKDKIKHSIQMTVRNQAAGLILGLQKEQVSNAFKDVFDQKNMDKKLDRNNIIQTRKIPSRKIIPKAFKICYTTMLA